MKSPQLENGYIRIATELFDALCLIRIPGEAHQVLNVIIRKTYGWGKKEDCIALSQFTEATGLSKIAVIKNIAKLTKMNLIVTQKGNANGNIYCINKKYSTWIPLPKKVTLPKKVMTITQKGNASLPKKVHTIDTTTIDTTTIDTTTIDTTIDNNTTSVKPMTEKKEHVLFLENWKKLYDSISGDEYKIDWAKDSSIITKLIKNHGYEKVLKKSHLLLNSCKSKNLWFTKNGIADFTIGKLSNKWNEILEESSTNAADLWLKKELEKDDIKK